ncbi:GAF domain-containing protein [Seonamhaeicola marinus]|uniref:GAF domain-containing protein n=1 Tax=Seonamhaeicola marinus TaxID=1912246 RepID=UPI001651C9CF|nr:GAF domain-containing protein [Seonamhaeicola marinus]
MLNKSKKAIIAVDNYGNITSINEIAAKFLGFSIEELATKKITEIYQNYEEAKKVKEKLKIEGPIDNYRTKLKTKQGKLKSINLDALMLNDLGDSVGFFYNQNVSKNEKLIEAWKIIFGQHSDNNDNLLFEIAKQVVEIFANDYSMENVFCCIAILEKNLLKLHTIFPDEAKRAVLNQIKEVNITGDSKIGVIGKAAKTGEIQVVSNTYDCEDCISIEGLDARSMIAVPLKSRDEIIGVLSISHPEGNYFNNSDVQNVKTIGHFAEVAVNKKLSNRRFIRLSEGLVNINETITKAVSYREVEAEILNIICEAFGCDIVTIHIYNNEFVFPFSMTGVNDVKRIREEEPMTKSSVPYRVLKAKKPIFSEDVLNSPIFKSSFNRREKVESAFATRLIFNQQIQGVFFLSFRTKHRFTKNEKKYLSLYSFSLARSLYELKLKDKLTTRSVTMTALSETFIKLNTQIDFEGFDQDVLENLKNIIDFDRGSLQLIERNRNRVLVDTHGCKKDEYSDYLLRQIEDDHLLQKVFNGQKTYFIEDVLKDHDWVSTNFTSKVKSWICIPIIARNTPIGLITLDFFEQFRHNDFILGVLTSYGTFLSQVMENNRLLKERKGHIEDLEEAEALAIRGLLYGEDIHYSANKLSAAKTFSDYLIKTSENFDKKQLDRINRISTNIKGFLDILEANISNIKPPVPVIFNIAKVLDQVISGMAKTKGVIIKNPHKDDNFIVNGYRRQIIQVFRVVIHNAIKALEGDGTIWIKIKKTNIKSNSYISVDIEDNGYGIPREKQAGLFEMKTPNMSKKSFGLGLGWTFYFLESYGGSIKFVSEEGQNTVFTINIPSTFSEDLNNRINNIGSKESY